MPGLLTYAIGDIHGCFTKLANVYRHCLDHSAGKPHRFVFLGDYVDRGKRTKDVIDFLIRVQAAAPDRVVCLMGNHEDLLLDAAKGENVALWLDNSGDTTLRSYGVMTAAEIPPAHLEWIAALPLSHADGKRFYVHAGIMPGVPLKKQERKVMLWMREPFLSDRRDHGLFIVHGHTPLKTHEPQLLPNRLNLDTMAVLGGPLTAAVFDEKTTGPLAFITDDGKMTKAPMITELEEAWAAGAK
jgi:serine/threonine protein phosphatase 1